MLVKDYEHSDRSIKNSKQHQLTSVGISKTMSETTETFWFYDDN